MKGEVQITAPEVAMVLGIRAAIGVGAGLLLADAFESRGNRRAVGRTLLLAGTYAGACLMAGIFGKPRTYNMAFGMEKEPGPAALAGEGV